MLLDQGMALMEKIAAELKDAAPEKRDHFLKSSLLLFDLALDALKTSPEFQEAFARVHVEFLNHPEFAKPVITKSIEAYKNYEKSISDN